MVYSCLKSYFRGKPKTAGMIGQIAFIVVFLLTFGLAAKKYREIIRNIRLGKDEDLSDNKGERFKNMMLVAFGQKKMFKRLLPAILHLLVYVAFLVTQIELIEIIIDGFSGGHRMIWKLIDGTFLAGLYTFTINFIEFLSLGALIATFAFLARRNLLKVPRFTMREMKGWPHMDANIILYLEIVLVLCIFTMNSTDQALQLTGDPHYPDTGTFLLSSMLVPLWEGMSASSLILAERIGWWGHILVVFIFLNYLPHSKHLHIMLAFPNTFFGKLEPKGQMTHMPEIQKEIELMMNPDTAFAEQPADQQEVPSFGAKDVQDLSWRNLLNAYSCTECGRCSAECPATQTGKLLSPRKIMMDTRDRLEEVGKNIDANKGEFKPDGKSLLHDYIQVEELRACTTCNACVEACPVNINPLDIILQLRRNLILEESNSPEEWNIMFNNIENNGAPWQFSPADRFKWSSDIPEKNA